MKIVKCKLQIEDLPARRKRIARKLNPKSETSSNWEDGKWGKREGGSAGSGFPFSGFGVWKLFRISDFADFGFSAPRCGSGRSRGRRSGSRLRERTQQFSISLPSGVKN